MNRLHESIGIPSNGGTSDWPRIDLADDVVTIGRSESCSTPIDHSSVSRKHFQVRRDASTVEISDCESRFGTFVNGVQISRTPLRINDIVRFGSSPPYRFDGTALVLAAEEIGMSLAAHDLCISRGGRVILQNVNLAIPSSSFVGVLGPSGMGKSMLLACLTSTMVPSAGHIEFDSGLHVTEHLEYFRSKIGIVPQDDLVFQELTAFENIRGIAKLRIRDDGVIPARIESSLRSVGMEMHAQKPVSILSGGQRKRVSIAIELVLRPRMLILDEPTSGLDPAMQAHVMEVLRTLARQGVTIICTTHTLETIHYFDTVIVLGRQGDAASVRYAGDSSRLQATFSVQNQADLFEKLQESGGSTSRLVPVEPRKETSTGGRAMLSPALHQSISDRVNVLRQAGVIFGRSLRTLLRDRASTTLALVQPCILAAISVISQATQNDRVFSMFFLILSSIWLGMTLTVRECVRERKLYVRDRLAGLNPEAYLLGKVTYALAVISAQMIILWGTARLLIGTIAPIAGAEYAATSSIFAIIVLCVVGFGGSLLALILSTCARTERSAISLLPLLLIPQMLFSKVAYGVGDAKYNEASVYSPIVKGFEDDPGHTAAPVARWINIACSLPMISRPGTWTLALGHRPPDGMSDEQFKYLMTESLYLTILLSIYGVTLVVVFRWSEQKWIDSRGQN